MTIFKNKDDLFKSISFLKGVGPKLSKYLKNKRIEKINDLLWHFPYSSTDRSDMVTLDKLEVGKIQTVKLNVKKYNFPRIRNLPNKVLCEDEFGKIDIKRNHSIFEVNNKMKDAVISKMIGMRYSRKKILISKYNEDPIDKPFKKKRKRFKKKRR